MKRRTRTLFIVLGVVVVLGIIIALNLRPKESGVQVETTDADYGSILSVVTATGELRAKSQVNLQAEVMGVVERLYVEEGDWVDKGDLMLELDRKSYEAQLVAARSRFTQARLSHTRVESLYQRGLVSEEQYEGSRAGFEMAEAQYDEAQDRHAKTSIRAPISGTVAKVNVEAGETVILGTMNNPGTVIMVIADMSKMQANVDVDETDVVSVKLGQSARVEVDALPDTSFPATVTKIGYMPTQNLLASESQGTDFEVEATLDSVVPELRPGMSVAVNITTASVDSVLVVPVSAVGRREVDGKERETVFVIENGRAKLKPLATGESSDTEVRVVDGLAPGEKVITGPYKVLSKLKDGRKVTPKKEKQDREDEGRRTVSS